MKSEWTATVIMLRAMFERTRKTLMWWVIGVSWYTIVNVAVYPVMKDSVLLQLDSYPQPLVEAFGLSNLNQIGPYLYAQVFLTLPLVLAFFPITIFSGQIAGAEERGGLDVMLTQPIRRRGYVLATWLLAVICVAIVLIVTGLLSWLTITLVGEKFGFLSTLKAAASVFPVTIAAGSIGLLLSALMRSRGAVLGASIGVIFLLYLADVISRLAPSLEKFGYISPFKYFDDIFTVQVPWWHYGINLVLPVLLLGIAIYIFERRDIYT